MILKQIEPEREYHLPKEDKYNRRHWSSPDNSDNKLRHFF